MTAILLISYFFCLFYTVCIVVFIIGWKRTKPFGKEDNKHADVAVSLIIPVRNDASVTARLLESLKKQTYKHAEIIIVNDHSTDDLSSVISPYLHTDKNIRFIDAIGEGKKNALAEGIAASKGELILCTDADCVPHPQWIQTMVDFYTVNQPDMIIAPVVMAYDNSAFLQMQALEFMSLQAATAGAACAGFPIMCNGANIAFTRKAWEENNQNLESKRLSGDDMFLMMSIKKRKGKISYLKSDEAIVYTTPSPTVSSFFNQRKRWVSKSPAYTDKDVILTALSVAGITLAMLLNLILAITVNTEYWISVGIIFLVKIIVDRILLYSFGSFARSTSLLRWMLPVSLIYPFYIIIAGISGLFGSFEWKGRKE